MNLTVTWFSAARSSIRFWSNVFYFSFLDNIWGPLSPLYPLSHRGGDTPLLLPKLRSASSPVFSSFRAHGKETGSSTFYKSQLSPTELTAGVSRVSSLNVFSSFLCFPWVTAFIHRATQVATAQISHKYPWDVHSACAVAVSTLMLHEHHLCNIPGTEIIFPLNFLLLNSDLG